VRVAIVTESFLPRVNGVTNSVSRILEHLAHHGHQALVIAPAPGPDVYAGHRVHTLPGFALPMYPQFVIGFPTSKVEDLLHSFRPDVVHLASPITLGASGVAAARRLGIPSVAVFQTDVPGFARRHGFRGADNLLWGWLRRLHMHADDPRTVDRDHASAARTPDPAARDLGPWSRPGAVPPRAPQRGAAPPARAPRGGAGGVRRPAVRRQAGAPAHPARRPTRLRAAMGVRARASVAGRSWAAVCDQLLGHYEDVLAVPRVRLRDAA